MDDSFLPSPARGRGAGGEGLPRVAVVLAAGKGTRMRSALPKVLHEAAGRPLLAWVVEAARTAGCAKILIVVGHGAEQVREAVRGDDVAWVLQAEQRGTGHALAQVEGQVDGAANLLVLSGDVPLVTLATLDRLATAAEEGWGAMAVTELSDPGSLGRVITTPDGRFERIVEAGDATPEELAVRRVNAGLYALPAPEIFGELARLTTRNAQGELYLTDAVTNAARAGHPIRLIPLARPDEAMGVNNRAELARVHRLLIERHLNALMESGVTILEPARTVIEPGIRVGPDSVIHADVALLGRSRVGGGCVLHQGAWIRDSRIEDGVTIEPYSVLDGAEVDDGCKVGPFARLRPGTRLRRGAKVGNFVEVKQSVLGEKTKVGHLAYVGDATVGDGANIGAGVITCNYDGVRKNPTEIGRGAFIGSDTMLVAPVRVGDGAMTAAGSVVTKNVPDGALAVARVRQKNLAGRSGGLRSLRKKTGDGPEEP